MKAKRIYAVLWLIFILFIACSYTYASWMQYKSRPKGDVHTQNYQSETTRQVIRDVASSGSVNAEIRLDWNEKSVIKAQIVLKETMSAEQVSNLKSALIDAIFQRTGQSPRNYEVEVFDNSSSASADAPILSWLRWLSTGMGIVMLGKLADLFKRSKGKGVKPYKEVYEQYFKDLAKYKWQYILHRSILKVHSKMTAAFYADKGILVEIAMLVQFSVLLNLCLAYVPLLLVIRSSQQYLMFHNISVALAPASIALINVPLDLGVYFLVKKVLARALRGKMPNIYAILSVLCIGWFCAGLSTVMGAVFSNATLVSNFWTYWNSIAIPLVKSWFLPSMIHPFVSNVQMSSVNMGYIALGALPASIFLTLTIAWMIVFARFPMVVLDFLRRPVNLIAKDEKSHFELLGYVAALVLLLIYWMIRLVNFLMH